MGRASPGLTSFNAGELSPRLEGRVETEKYQAGLRVCENYIPLIQGPLVRRSGTRFVGEVKASVNRTWLVPFQFSTSQAYMLEFGDRYVRFYSNQARVVVSGVAAYNGATAYAVGALVVQGGVNYYCIAATTGNAPPNSTYWYALTGNIYEIPSPYTAADLTGADGTLTIRATESADVVYICLQGKPQQKLTRFGPTNWTIAPLQTVGGPFKTLNLTTTTVQASATTGNITLTASTGVFLPGHVNSLFYLELQDLSATKPWEGYAVLASGTGANPSGLTCRSGNRSYTCTTTFSVVAPKGEVRSGTDRPLHTHGSAYDGRNQAIPNGPELCGVLWRFDGLTYGAVLITGYTNATTVTGIVVAMRAGGVDSLPAGVVSAPTNRWAFGAWSDVEGWPSHAAFFRERLAFARGQQIWLSTAADFENFNEFDDNGLVVADSSIKLRLPSEQQDDICWMRVLSPTVEALMVGTGSEEFAVKSQTENQPFGTDNVTAQLLSGIGSRNVVPVKVGPALLFVQRLGVKLRDLVYDAYGNNGGSNDQTLYAEHVPRPRLDQLAYQQDPSSIVWARRSDGQLVAMTYSREQYANPPHGGWHRHPMTNGSVECISSIAGADRNELWMIVNRTIAGVTRRYVELLEAEFADDTPLTSAFYVDCGLSYNGAAATTFSGLDHLNGQTVSIIADGAVRPQQVVAAGAVTLDTPASVVSIGLPLCARMQTMRLNAGAQDGTSQGKKTKIPQGVVRLQNTVGLKFGPSFDILDEMDFRTPSMAMDTAIPLFTGDKEFNWPTDTDGYNFNPWLCFQQDDPLPGTIVAVFPQSLVSDKG
jgi:hypothetical protein